METLNGRATTITEINFCTGFVHGYVAGYSEPQVWGYPDGECFSYLRHQGPGFNLNMEMLQCHQS